LEGHPTAEDFECLLQRSPKPSNAERNASVVRHLLAGCEACRTTLRELREVQALFNRMFDLPNTIGEVNSPASHYNYEWAFARADRTLRAQFTQSIPPEGLREQLAKLLSLSEGEQIRRARAGGHFADPEIVQDLMGRSHSARYRSPRKTLHLSLLARLAAEACTADKAGGQEQLADLQVQAWGAFANAQRICGDLLASEEAFAIAFQKEQSGTRSPQLRAALLSQLCSLRIFQRRFEAALDLALEAEGICDSIGENSLLASVLVVKGTVLLHSGEAEKAVDTLQRAIPKIDQEEDPLLFLAVHHNLARCYIDLDQPDEAVAVLFEVRNLYKDCDPLILLRAIWQEGQLLREVGHFRNAEAALLRARQGFEEQGLAYEMAVVCLDLGEVYWKLGLLDRLRESLAEAVPIFRSLRVSRETLAALLRLQQAAELESPSDD
jgi:tetratricopeptide (TPR) repeat protein